MKLSQEQITLQRFLTARVENTGSGRDLVAQYYSALAEDSGLIFTSHRTPIYEMLQNVPNVRVEDILRFATRRLAVNKWRGYPIEKALCLTASGEAAVRRVLFRAFTADDFDCARATRIQNPMNYPDEVIATALAHFAKDFSSFTDGYIYAIPQKGER